MMIHVAFILRPLFLFLHSAAAVFLWLLPRFFACLATISQCYFHFRLVFFTWCSSFQQRFAREPQVYESFLDILHAYKQKRTIEEVFARVQKLFEGHQDLLDEFKVWLAQTDLHLFSCPSLTISRTHRLSLLLPQKELKLLLACTHSYLSCGDSSCFFHCHFLLCSPLAGFSFVLVFIIIFLSSFLVCFSVLFAWCWNWCWQSTWTSGPKATSRSSQANSAEESERT